MTSTQLQPEISRLAPPPRAIPLTLRFRLFANLGALIGAAVIGGGLVMASFWAPLSGLSATWKLDRQHLQAPGVLEKIEETNVRVNEQPISRYVYRFALPDGRSFTGFSYSRALAPRQGERVTIEYLQSDPSISRIHRMTTTLAPLWVPLMVLLPGAICLIASLMWARRRLRALRDGELAFATIKSFQPATAGEGPSPVLSPAQFRELWEKLQRPLLERASSAPMTMARFFMSLWFVVAIGGAAFGLVIIVVGIALLVRSNVEHSLLFGVLLAILWLALAAFIIRFGLRFRRLMRNEIPLTTSITVRCEYQFTAADGSSVEAQQHVLFDGGLAADDAPEPVLYEPARPEAAILLRGLPVSIAISPLGELETSASTSASVLRMCVFLLLLVVPLAFYLST